MRGDNVVHLLDVVLIESLQQHEQVESAGLLQQRIDCLSREHPQDHQNTPGSGGAGLDDLVGIDQEVLAHGRHLQRLERTGAGLQMRHRAIKLCGLGEDRNGGGASASVGGDACGHVLIARLQLADGGRTQLQLRNQIKPTRMAAQRRWRTRCARTIQQCGI